MYGSGRLMEMIDALRVDNVKWLAWANETPDPEIRRHCRHIVEDNRTLIEKYLRAWWAQGCKEV